MHANIWSVTTKTAFDFFQQFYFCIELLYYSLDHECLDQTGREAFRII